MQASVSKEKDFVERKGIKNEIIAKFFLFSIYVSHVHDT